jgi:hypothetical protein
VGINTTSGNVSGILIDIGSNPILAANQKPNNMTTEIKMKNQWYVSQNVQQDYDTMLFTKRVKSENLNMDKDRVIAHVEGITLEEAESNANIIAAAPEMVQLLNWIDMKYGDIEGDRELSPIENQMIGRVREVLTLINGKEN